MDKPTNWIVETRDLTRVYGDGEAIRALDGVDMHISRGELVAVMGPSGSGKSTLLNIIGALDKPTSGQVFVDGQDVAKIRNKDKFRARTVGFMFQLHNLLPTMTARENVEVPMIGQMGKRARRKRAEELLSLCGLAVILGHIYSIFLGFKGGKGVATAGGVFLALSPISLIFCFVLFGFVVYSTKYVSLGSILAAIAFLFIEIGFQLVMKFPNTPKLFLTILVVVMIIVRHKANIKRLLEGNENKFGQRVPKQD